MSRVAINNKLRMLREADPFMSQQALGEALGVSRQTIIAIEGGRYAPSLELALRIAAHFDMPVEDIFSLKPDQ